jgi:hypothetical protein
MSLRDCENPFPFRGKGTLEAGQKAGMGVGFYSIARIHPIPTLPFL